LALSQSHVIICHCRPQRSEAISYNKLSLREAQPRGNLNLFSYKIATLPLVARNGHNTHKVELCIFIFKVTIPI